jgi:predicted nucleic-acid-binding protein
MIAADTNILVRLLTGDDPSQARAAQSVFTADSIWIAKTVLLEAHWVLRHLYGFDEQGVRDAFTRLLGLSNVRAEDESSVAAALALTTHGVEFAGALHLVSRPPDSAFVSFDRALVRGAKRAGVSQITWLPYSP